MPKEKQSGINVDDVCLIMIFMTRAKLRSIVLLERLSRYIEAIINAHNTAIENPKFPPKNPHKSQTPQQELNELFHNKKEVLSVLKIQASNIHLWHMY